MQMLRYAILILLLSSCATQKPPPAPDSINAKVDQVGEMIYLHIIDLRSVIRNHLLNVQAVVYNSDSDNQQLFYRFKWIDANGFEVGPEEAWKPLQVYAYQQQAITSIAPSPQVTDFRLVVQSPANTGLLP